MKILIALLLLPIFFLQSAFAFSLEEVQQHSTPNDCWVIFENKVYDLTEYIDNHDIYLDIRQWCGRDMTDDFKDKADMGLDHKTSSYYLLEQYYIGDIEQIGEEREEEPVLISSNESNGIINERIESSKPPYNIVFPLLFSVIGYWLPYFMIKKNILKTNIKSFNAFWNSMLIFLLLIPAFGFGVYMILRYRFPSLWSTGFDFMYWHVELSLVMGILGLNHFIQRIKIYLLQLKK